MQNFNDQDVTFIEEHDLAFDQGTASYDNRLRVTNELVAASTPAARMTNIRSMLSIMGFNSLHYEVRQLSGERTEKTLFLKSYLPAQWTADYFRQGFHALDPRLEAIRTCPVPLIWDLRYLARTQPGNMLSPHMRSFLDDLAKHGMNSGVAFSLTVPLSSMQVAICINSANTTKDWIAPSIAGQALILGLSVHEFIKGCTAGLMRRSEIDDLSDMQKHVLAGVSKGLSDKEIARGLRTTVHNIDYHLRALRRKYQAMNRAQLAYVAGRLAIV
ncbi:MAG TPA: autoinducer binding domain-containing protein [Noviherbaspirillum sp.]|nr:autoinducer binding domain-containing protein [Noviherbaspirillum sp.]